MDTQNFDSFISFGDGVKTLSRTADTATVGARGIIFGSPQERDLVGDWFTEKTYLGARKGVGVDMMLNHGIPLGNTDALKAFADTLLPPVVKTEDDEYGLLYQTVLSLKDNYQRKIFQMVEDGLFSSSTGALNHTVKRKGNVKAGEIERWIIGEISFTPNPCEPRVGFAAPLKSLMDAETYQPEAMAAAVKTLTDTSMSMNVPLDIQELEAMPEVASEPSQIKSHSFGSSAEVVTAVTGILRASMPLDWHLESARAAVKSFMERANGVIDTRCVKSGRVLSADNHAVFCSWCDSLERIAREMRAKLEAHAPDTLDTKSLEAEIEALEIEWLQTESRLAGVAV